MALGDTWICGRSAYDVCGPDGAPEWEQQDVDILRNALRTRREYRSGLGFFMVPLLPQLDDLTPRQAVWRAQHKDDDMTGDGSEPRRWLS